MDAPSRTKRRVNRLAPVCNNCGASDFVWANDLKTGGIGGGSLSLRSRGELSLGTRICRACGHADLFMKDPSILRMPHTWKPGEFTPIASKPGPAHHAAAPAATPTPAPAASHAAAPASTSTPPEPPTGKPAPHPDRPIAEHPAAAPAPPAPSPPPPPPPQAPPSPPMAAPPPPPPPPANEAASSDSGKKSTRRRGSKSKD